MIRAVPLVFVASLPSTVGCSNAPITAGDGSSSMTSSGSLGDGSEDPGTTTALGGSMSGQVDATTSTSDGGLESTTTGEPELDPGKRLLLMGEDGCTMSLSILSYREDGEVSDPIPIVPELPSDGSLGPLLVSDARSVLGYCVRLNEPFSDGTCYVVDLASHTPGPPQSFSTGLVPDDLGDPWLEWVEATQTFVVRGHAFSGVPDAIYAASVVDGELQPAELIAEAGLAQTFGRIQVREDGAWVVFTVSEDGGSQNAALAPLDSPDPLATVMMSDFVDPEHEAHTPVFVPGQDMVLYAADIGLPHHTLWLVELAGGVPSTPLRIDDPLLGGANANGLSVAPDGHALVYLAGSYYEGELMFVDLSPGGSRAPIRVSTLGDAQVSHTHVGWSPDSRVVYYLARHQQPDAHDAYVVDASGATPGEPRLVSNLVPNSNISILRFDDASQWLYYVGWNADDEGPQLHRVDVSGSEPGELQRVSDGTTVVEGELVASPDWSTVLYHGSPEWDGYPELHRVDVSGPDPGEPLRIGNPFLGAGYYTTGGWFSPDGSVAFYVEKQRSEWDCPRVPQPLRGVNMGSLDVFNISQHGVAVIPVD